MTAEIVGRGATLRDAFVEAAVAVFTVAVDPARVEERELREVRAHGATEEALLAHWISECLYVHEVEGFVGRRIELPVFETRRGPGGEPLRLHSLLHGEALDPDRHRVRATVKGVRPASAAVLGGSGSYEVRILLEVDCRQNDTTGG